MYYRVFISLLLVLNILFTKDCFSQINDSLKTPKPDKVCEPKDIRDLFRKKNKKPKPPKKTSLLLLPNISSNPTNGFLLGVGGNLTTFLDQKKQPGFPLLVFQLQLQLRSSFCLLLNQIYIPKTISSFFRVT